MDVSHRNRFSPEQRALYRRVTFGVVWPGRSKLVVQGPIDACIQNHTAPLGVDDLIGGSNHLDLPKGALPRDTRHSRHFGPRHHLDVHPQWKWPLAVEGKGPGTLQVEHVV